MLPRVTHTRLVGCQGMCLEAHTWWGGEFTPPSNLYGVTLRQVRFQTLSCVIPRASSRSPHPRRALASKTCTATQRTTAILVPFLYSTRPQDCEYRQIHCLFRPAPTPVWHSYSPADIRAYHYSSMPTDPKGLISRSYARQIGRTT